VSHPDAGQRSHPPARSCQLPLRPRHAYSLRMRCQLRTVQHHAARPSLAEHPFRRRRRWLLRAAPLQPQVTTPPALACSTNTAADLLLTKYAAATDDLTRAKLLRALLMSYCGGNFNPLFSVSLSLAAFNPMGSRVWLCLLHTVAGRGDGEEELPCTPSRPVISAMFCTASMPGQVAGATTHGVAPCAGPHPQGDGVTWTGMGGLLSPLGEEFIAPPQSLQGADYKFVSFCINGVTGSPLQPGGSCPLPA